MPFEQYAQLDALGLAEAVRAREVSPAELVEEAIDRIERFNPAINAVVRKLYDAARASARESLPQGAPFAGVPFLLKDLHQKLTGVRTANGCRFYRDAVADHDTELVRRYRAAGFVFVGKTNTPELGIVPVTEPELFGPTRNPWSLDRTSGGSSGGSAAAVAAGIVPMAHGGDGGGSIRIPASCCGLFGLKPTRARTPFGPDESEGWNGFAQDHVVSRSVRDSAAALDVGCGPEATSPYYAPPRERPYLEEVDREPGALRIAFHAEPAMGGSVHPDCMAALNETVRLCEELGHHVEEVRPEHPAELLQRSFFTVVVANTRADIADAERYLGRRATPDQFETTTWLSAQIGGRMSAGDMAEALRTLQAESRRLTARYAGFDVVLTPTLAKPPVRIGELLPHGAEKWAMEVISRLKLHAALDLPGVVDRAARRIFEFIPFTPVANFTGQPSMSVPLYWSSAGLPIGTMFTARFGDEATLFRLAGQLERARPWRDHRPPAF